MEYIPLLFREPIPLDVRVVITTKTGENYVQGRRCVLFEEDSDPRNAIEKALMLLLGKTQFREVIIGIDPGKQTGLAVLGDGLLLVSGTYVHAKNLVDEITRILPAFPSERAIMRIGKGAEKYSSALIAAISSKLPTSVEIQVVEEAGTTDNHLLPEAGNGLSHGTPVRPVVGSILPDRFCDAAVGGLPLRSGDHALDKPDVRDRGGGPQLHGRDAGGQEAHCAYRGPAPFHQEYARGRKTQMRFF